jgi:RHS repeat-associated protein
MKTIQRFVGLVTAMFAVNQLFAQANADLNLQTRWTGQPPNHETPTAAAKWMQNPVALRLEIGVTNLYADTNAYMEVDIGGQRLIFYGAGVDVSGAFIPTNYPPVTVDAALRRQYPVTITCPNSGPDGSPCIKWTDINNPHGLAGILMSNWVPVLVSQFLWTSFSAAGRSAIINDNPGTDPSYLITQTNLVNELNRIINSGSSIYDPTRFAGVSLGQDTTDLLAQNPQGGQSLVLLNRMLLRDACAYYPWPNNYDFQIQNRRDNSGTAEIHFSVQPPPELTILKNQATPQYSVVVNGSNSRQLDDGSSQIDLMNTGNGDLSTNSAVIQVSKSKFGHFAVGDGCDDPRPAPGVGKWLSLGPGCSADTNRISLEWSVSLGRTFDGLAAGQLALHETGLSWNTYTPDALYYNAASTNLLAEISLVTTNILTLVTNASGDVYTNVDSPLRQVMACQTFVDIVTPDTNQTVLNFYYPSQVATNLDENGVYTNITGQPFVTWTIRNPDPSTANNLQIIETRPGNSAIQSLVKTASAGGVTWTLTQGSGPEQRVETRAVSFVGSPATDRVEWDTIANSGITAYQCKETYHFYAWGSELKETRIPNSPADLVTTYDYYEEDETFYDAVEDEYSYGITGMLKQIVYPDGYWEKREYHVGCWDWFYGWIQIASLHVFTPFIESVSGGATTPDEANMENSSCLEIAYSPYDWTWNCDQQETTYDQLNVTGGNSISSNPNAGTWDDQLKVDWSTGDSDFCGHGHVLLASGNHTTDTYCDSASPGLAGHVAFDAAGINEKTFYFDRGLFDPVANQFSYTGNHIYNWSNFTNPYPDHRETEFDDAYGVLLGIGIGVPSQYSDLYSHGVYTSLEDHLFTGWYGSTFYLFPTLSTKTTKIYHAGNLVQTEEYVYTAAGTTDGSGHCSNPLWSLLYQTRYYVDSLGRATNVVRIDPISGNTQVIYSADYRGASGYDGPRLLSETDETGNQTSYTYDSLQRVATMTVKGYGSQPDQVFTYAYDANGQKTSQTITASSLSVNQSWAFDLAGRIINHVDQSGIATQTSYSADNRTITTTSPGAVTIIQQNSIDRTPLSVQGNGCVAKFYENSLFTVPCEDFGGEMKREQTIHLGHTGSARWQNLGQGLNGDPGAWNEKPVGGGSINTVWSFKFDFMGFPGATFLVFEDHSAESPSISYTWDPVGNVAYTAQSVTVNDGTERVVRSAHNYITVNGTWYQATTNFIYLSDSDETYLLGTVTSIHLEQLDGFAPNQIAGAMDYDADMNQTITSTTVDRNHNKITTVTSQPNTSSLNATTIYQNGLPISASTLSVASPTLYFYDALGRTNRIQSPLGFSAYINYDPATGWVTSTTDFTGQTTSYQYYGRTEANAGKLKCQISATGKKTYYAYTTQGRLYQTWGDVPYPAQYNYNEYGDLTNLVTFRGGSGWTSSTWPANPGTGDNTCWVYDEASGALLQKVDAQGKAVTYTYNTDTGHLLTRSWARTFTDANNNIVPVNVTNYYDGFGDLVEQQYNDGTPNVYLNNYNRAGQPREIIDGSGTNELTYDYACRLVTSTCINGLFNGITVSNHFNPYYGRDAVAVLGLSSPPLEGDYGYDAYGRLGKVSSGNYSATYGYVPNSDLLQSTTFSNNSTPVLTTTRTWDYGMRLRSIANVVGSAPVTSHSYQYDALNRRTQATLEDGSWWQYGYDDRDELTSANRHWASWQNNTPVSGQQFNYAYDNIGNRQTAGFGGDINGVNQRTIAYTNNSLNQYIGILTPSYANIIGAAFATNNVTVNNGATDRKAEYFHREIAVANGSGPAWQNVTNISGTFTNQGGLLVPASSQVLTYDADGNLSSDSIWTYQWDAENRLISMTMANVANIAATNRLRLDFAYDFMGRRIQKIVSVWNSSTLNYQPSTTNRFVYDCWNLFAILNPQSSILQSFMWGNDLSGSLQGAGGVGGLLMASISGTNCFATYDGNGNITSLINASDKSLAARYEYSPYGELLRETGLLAHQNPLRFSTKYWDEESGLVYYNYRYYNPVVGKWISRDPLEEKGGLNLLAFVVNNPITTIDTNGKDYFSDFFSQFLGPIVKGTIYAHFLDDSISDFLSGTLGGVLTDKIADITINPKGALNLLAIVGGMEVQEMNFMQNAQNIITSRWQDQNAKNNLTGLVVGLAAAAANANGGNGDDLILDASLNAAATAGVDSSETIWGVATDIAD